MNRFDDKLSWRVFEKFIVPLITAVLMGAVIWGSVRERINTMEKWNAGSRLTTLEANYTNMHDDMKDIKSDVKEILRRMPRR